MWLMVMILASTLVTSSRASTSSQYRADNSNYYSYGRANGHVAGHENLGSDSYQRADGSFGYSYRYGNPYSDVQVSFTSGPSYTTSASGFRQSAIKSGRPQPIYRAEPVPAMRHDQYASPSSSNYRYSLAAASAKPTAPPIYNAATRQPTQTSYSYGAPAVVAAHDVDNERRYPVGGHQYSVGTFKVPAYPVDLTKQANHQQESAGSGQSFRELYQYHPDTYRYAHPEKVVPLNVFGLPPQHRFQHPVGNVDSAVPIVVHTNAFLPGPVVDRGVKKGSGHYEDSQKFHRLYSQHPDTYRYVNPERNTPLNVFGLPPQHQYQSPYGNVNGYRPQEVLTNGQLPGPVVDVLLSRPSLSSSFTGRVPTTVAAGYPEPQYRSSQGANSHMVPLHNVDLKGARGYDNAPVDRRPEAGGHRLQETASQQYASVAQSHESSSNKQKEDDHDEHDDDRRPYAKYSKGPVRFSHVANVDAHRNNQQQQSYSAINVQPPFNIINREYFNINPIIRSHGEYSHQNVLPVRLDQTLFREDRHRGTQGDNKGHVTQSPVNVIRFVQHHPDQPRYNLANNNNGAQDNNNNYENNKNNYENNKNNYENNKNNNHENNKNNNHENNKNNNYENNNNNNNRDHDTYNRAQETNNNRVHDNNNRPQENNYRVQENNYRVQENNYRVQENNYPVQENPKNFGPGFVTPNANVQQLPLHNFLMAQYPQQVTLRTIREHVGARPTYNLQFANDFKHDSQQTTLLPFTGKSINGGQEERQTAAVANNQSKRKYIYQRPPLDYTLIKLTPMRVQLGDNRPPIVNHKNYNYVGFRNELDGNRFSNVHSIPAPPSNYQALQHPQGPSNYQFVPAQQGPPQKQRTKSAERVPEVEHQQHRHSVRHIASQSPPQEVQSRRYQYGSLDYTPVNRQQNRNDHQYQPGSLLSMLLPEFLKFGLGLSKSVTPITEPAKYDQYGYSYNRPRKGFHVKLGLSPFLETKVLF